MELSIIFRITGTVLLVTFTFALENLALNKTTEMSSQRTNSSGAEGAVDGNTAQTVGSDSCALTDLNYRPEAWWRVDLNGTYAITELKIYLLNTELWRFRWFSIHVTDDLDNWKSSYCTRDHLDVDGPDTSVVTLNCDAKGRFVTIWSDRRTVCSTSNVNYCAILQLCEVQVLGCNPGNYGRNCNLTCPVNCRDDLCSIDNGDCYGCKDGYIGSTCGTQNLALNKKTEMSSQRTNSSGAEGAVDGNTAQAVGSDSCALTDLHYRPEAWWRVDLNGTYAITELKIYLLNTELYRFRFYSIHVTDDLDNWNLSYCTRDHVDADGPDTSVVTLNCDAKGRYVTIWSDRRTACSTVNVNFCAILQLCEVQVLGCNPGIYGRNCNLTCPVNCRENLCTIDNGDCYGCKDGFIGNACGTKCDAGSYGQNCKEKCNGFCANGDICSHVNGVCPNGCKDGYLSKFCNISCSFGYFGPNCDQTCGNCLNNMTCSLTNGYCHNGCASGWKGFYCKTSCDAGQFGANCLESCSENCKESFNCDRFTGSCTDGCKPGWIGDTCNTACSSGTFGHDCSDTCGNCSNNEVCFHTNGSCANGCASGWKGLQCKTICSPGEYGFDCSKSCSINCLDSSDCDFFTGRCHGGCVPGWTGDTCNTSCLRERFGENCSFSCPLCEFGCHSVNGDCLSLGVSDTTHVSITPWVVTGVACTITVLVILFYTFLCRRGQGQICSKAKRSTTGAAASSYGTGAENKERSDTTGNYEELRAAVSKSNVYDSLGDGNVQYENTFRA